MHDMTSSSLFLSFLLPFFPPPLLQTLNKISISPTHCRSSLALLRFRIIVVVVIISEQAPHAISATATLTQSRVNLHTAETQSCCFDASQGWRCSFGVKVWGSDGVNE
jgi:hypothetical protein